MTITFVAADDGSHATSDVVVTKPAGTADGDYLLAIGWIYGTGSVLTAPAGWSLLFDAGLGDIRIWGKPASGEPTNYTFTNPSGAAAAVGMTAYRGSNITLDLLSTMGNGNSADPVAPAITTTKSGLLIFAGSSSLTPTGTRWSPPAGMTEHLDSITAEGKSFFFASEAFGVGNTGTRTATVASSIWRALLFQFYEAPSQPNNLFFGSNF